MLHLGKRLGSREIGHEGGIGFRLGGLALLLDAAHREHRELIKQHHRDREHELRDHVRRGQHGRHDEHEDDGVAPLFLEKLRIDDAGLPEQGQADGIGIVFGIVMGRKIPERTMKWVAALLFIGFGIAGLYENVPPEFWSLPIVVAGTAALLFCMWLAARNATPSVAEQTACPVVESKLPLDEAKE